MTTKERPILFSAEMICALLDNRKTQTRRLVKPQPANGCSYTINGAGSHALHYATETAVGGFTASTAWVPVLSKADHRLPCPYGVAGDVLWAKEAWRAPKSFDDIDATKMAALCKEAGYERPWAPVQYEADGSQRDWWSVRDEVEGPPGRYRHARFMPRWASRITLTLTADARVERVQDITEADAIAEGCTGFDPEPASEGGTIYAWRGQSSAPDPRAHYAALWQRINGVESWERNDWVWVVTFAVKEIKR